LCSWTTPQRWASKTDTKYPQQRHGARGSCQVGQYCHKQTTSWGRNSPPQWAAQTVTVKSYSRNPNCSRNSQLKGTQAHRGFDKNQELSPTKRKKGKEMRKIKQTQSSLQNWNKRLEELVQFKQKHVHCNIPRKYAPNPTLGNWVENQRRRHSGTHLPPLTKEEYDKLHSIGFDWNPFDTAWDNYFQRLFRYLEKTGLPPASTSKLGLWIRTQRCVLRGKLGKQQLPQERIDKLWKLPLQIYGFPPVH
jgi:hypothetical protein